MVAPPLPYSPDSIGKTYTEDSTLDFSPLLPIRIHILNIFSLVDLLFLLLLFVLLLINLYLHNNTIITLVNIFISLC